ncbi:hypothetical protein [Croceicoccus sp. BE223]|uniref:hypothetical protein n=1 Tax=Croceicoccus sp. BE223 TaxID=2817716 RepID=UPI00285699DB|nr:hypothetical protein [Croceicoccus sp. BE223]MDR7102048.1 hypothetical protein [Croceicoccus sp. BE223]
MSGVDIVARGMAVAAGASQPALFTQFADRALPAGLTIVQTSGHATAGMGAGRYCHDALATAALLEAHPRFAFRARDGRVFRLLPENGVVTVEQGGAVGDGAANDQPAIQATIDYAAATGIAEVKFEARHYAVWAIPRSAPRIDSSTDEGHPIVIRRTVALTGLPGTRTVLDFRGLDGADPETNWQVVPESTGGALTAWRGGGIFVMGDRTLPPEGVPLKVEVIELHNLVLQGNRVRTGNSTPGADPDTGDGWDMSDKGFSVQDCHVGDVRVVDCEIHGFKGELFYVGALSGGDLVAHRCHFHTTNANVWNPGTNMKLDAMQCEFGNGHIAHEDTGKQFARYTACVWRDAASANFGGGPANGFGANYLFPTRSDQSEPPLTQLDGCEFRNIGDVYVGCWVRGRLRTVDSRVLFSTNLYSELRDVDIEIEAWMDRRGNFAPVVLEGPDTLTEQIPGAAAGTYRKAPRNMRVHVRAMRTSLAIANGIEWIAPTWYGYIEPSVRLIVEGEGNLTPYTWSPTSMPKIDLRDYNTTHPAQSTFGGAQWSGIINSSRSVTPSAVHMGFDQEGAGPFDITLNRFPNGGAGFGYANGQKLRIYLQSNQGALRFVKDTPGMRLSQTRTLKVRKDFIEFTYSAYEGGYWEESAFFTSADPGT